MVARAIHWETWALNAEADRRFLRILIGVAIPVLILAIIISVLHFDRIQRGGGVLQNSTTTVRLLPSPPARPAVKPEEPKPQPKPVPLPQEAAPKAVTHPQPHKAPAKQAHHHVAPTVPRPTPRVSARQRAQQLAAASGLNELSALSDSTMPTVSQRALISGQITTRGGRAGGSSDTAATRAIESSVAATAGAGAGGRGSAPVTRAQSGVGIGRRRTGTVTSSIGFGRDRSRVGANGNAVRAGRSLREIQLVFDRNKGAFYALYNRALRRNPNEQGKIVVSLTIAPDGHVSECHMVYSTMGDSTLEREVVTRVKMMNFGARAVPPFTYPNYPIHFVPPS